MAPATISTHARATEAAWHSSQPETGWQGNSKGKQGACHAAARAAGRGPHLHAATPCSGEGSMLDLSAPAQDED